MESNMGLLFGCTRGENKSECYWCHSSRVTDLFVQVLEKRKSENPDEPQGDEGFSDEILGLSPKSYQLWNHRRQIVEGKELGKESLAYELGFAESALEENTKSHHAWGHRQAVLAKCQADAVTQEENFVDRYLDEDLHNNSTWTQRYFLLEKKLNKNKASAMQDKKEFEASSMLSNADVELLVEGEVKYVSDKIQQAPHNKAAWSYLLGMMGNTRLVNAFLKNIQLVFHLTNDVLKKWPSCSPAVDFLGQLYCKLFSMAAAIEDGEKAKKAAKNAVECWRNLQVLDPIRTPYYQCMMTKMEMRLAVMLK